MTQTPDIRSAAEALHRSLRVARNRALGVTPRTPLQARLSLKRWVAWTRKEHKCSQNEAARRLGIAPSVLSKLLLGKHAPSLDLAVLLQMGTEGSIPCQAWANVRRRAA